jgi:DNA-binding FadR family transcriptional regulator
LEHGVVSATQEVLEWVMRFIQEKSLQNGDVLPGELEIAQTIGVGRSSVREACAALKAFGVTKSKAGVGLILAEDPRRLDLMSLFTQEHFNGKDYQAVRQLRNFIELGAVDIILANATQEQVEKLRRLVVMISLKDDSPLTPLEFEIRFHEQLALITGNHLIIALSLLYRPLFQYHSDYVLHPEASAVMPDRDIDNHAAVVQALMDRNHDALVEAMRKQMMPDPSVVSAEKRLSKGKK